MYSLGKQLWEIEHTIVIIVRTALPRLRVLSIERQASLFLIDEKRYMIKRFGLSGVCIEKHQLIWMNTYTKASWLILI